MGAMGEGIKKIFTKGGAELAAVFGVILAANSFGYLPTDLRLFGWADVLLFIVLIIGLSIAFINIGLNVYKSINDAINQVHWERINYDGSMIKKEAPMPTIIDVGKDIVGDLSENLKAKAETKKIEAQIELEKEKEKPFSNKGIIP